MSEGSRGGDGDRSSAAGLCQIALEVAREAGELVRAGWRSRPTVTEKAAKDLVTEYDLRSEQLIRQRLAELTPDIAVVAEERGGRARSGLTWFCDPLDGTTNFVHGHSFWAVSIGLLEQGRPIAGAVVAPCIATEWTAYAGGPALRNGTPCHVNSIEHFDRALFATGFPAQRDREPANNLSAFGAVIKRAQGIRRCGSAAIDLCLVADGTYAGFWERGLNGWDLAAGAGAVLAAGGTVTHLDGAPIQLERGNIAASNGRLHGELLELLGPHL